MIITLNCRSLKRHVLVGLLCLLTGNTGSAVGEVADLWSAINQSHTSFDSARSPYAQDGSRVAIIDGTTLQFKEEDLFAYRGFMPKGFLFQTFPAQPYHGKHLHVSAFARNSPPKFRPLEEWFKEQFLQWREVSTDQVNSNKTELNIFQRRRLNAIRSTPVDEVMDWFSEQIRGAYQQANYGIWVVLHSPQKSGTYTTSLFKPTSSSRKDKPELWHRFNVEVSVPESCELISIVFWSFGVSRAEVDHFAVVENGTGSPEPDAGVTVWELVDQKDLYDQLRGTISKHAGNLSFER